MAEPGRWYCGRAAGDDAFSLCSAKNFLSGHRKKEFGMFDRPAATSTSL